MKIQILGSGCAKCKQLYANAEAAVQAAGVSAELEKVEDIQRIAAMGVMITPALAIDGQVKAKGQVLTPEAIAALLTA